MQEKQRCHCNGSRGTDCDWCGGSGWKTDAVRLDISHLNEPNNKKSPLPLSDKKTHKISVLDQNAVSKKKPNFLENINKPKDQKKTVEERIKDFNLSLNNINEVSDETISYLRKKIYELNAEVILMGKKIPKKKKNYIKLIKTQCNRLIIDFERKFVKK